MRVVVVEADRIAAGVSGYATAKLTVGHGPVYSRLEEAFDAQTARSYAQSQSSALAFVRRLVQERSIDCELADQTNYVFGQSDGELEMLEREASAARQAGLNADLVTDLDLPFPAVGAVRLRNQAQFHVRKYLLRLAGDMIEAGGMVVERSRVIAIESAGQAYHVRTNAGRLRAPVVVVATHYPIVERGFFATRIHPRRSYVVAARVAAADAPSGMYINLGSPAPNRPTTTTDGSAFAPRLPLKVLDRVGQVDLVADETGLLERLIEEPARLPATVDRQSSRSPAVRQP
jgi:glycine/D-amino acid oxidase-like deaminating enzyme